MENDTQKIIQERFRELPKSLQKIITAFDFRNAFDDISERHNLHIDQAGNLENETMLALLGFESLDDFETNLEKNIPIDAETAQKIADDVNNRIFLPIREEMQKLEGVDEEKSKENVSSPVKTPARGESAQITEIDAEIPENLPTKSELPPISSPEAPQTQIETEKPVVTPEGRESFTPAEPQTDAQVENLPLQEMPEQKIEEKSTETPQETPKAPQPRDRSIYKTDPYREPIE